MATTSGLPSVMVPVLSTASARSFPDCTWPTTVGMLMMSGIDAGDSYVIFGRDFLGGVIFAGTAGADALRGSSRADTLNGLAGADTIRSVGNEADTYDHRWLSVPVICLALAGTHTTFCAPFRSFRIQLPASLPSGRFC